MGQLFDAVTKFFDDDEWNYERMGERPVLRLGFSGKNGRWLCYARIDEERNQFFFYSVCGQNAPEDKRTPVSEFLTRANYGMQIGNFEMDFEDGEIRYKTSVDFDGFEPNNEILKNLVYANIITMDRYLPGLMQVIWGGVDPREAVAAIEGDD